MPPTVFAAVLLAALLHASWNAVLKLGLDRFRTALVLVLAQGAMAALIMPFVPWPGAEALPWIIAGALLHAGYNIFLLQAYSHADLSAAYPLARGTAPVIVMLISISFLGERFTPGQLAAVGLICAGILVMAAKGSALGRMGGTALFYALGTACFTAGYTLVDGMGARIAPSAASYLMATMALATVIFALWALAHRGRGAFRGFGGQWRGGAAAGAMSIAAYWIVVWAFTQAPIALVAALRESSILFAVLISALVLGERVNRWRWLSALGIAGGVVILRV